MQRREPRADVGNARQVDLGKTDPALVPHVEQHLAPRVDHQRMAEGVAAVLVAADLGGGDHEQPGLDRLGELYFADGVEQGGASDLVEVQADTVAALDLSLRAGCCHVTHLSRADRRQTAPLL